LVAVLQQKSPRDVAAGFGSIWVSNGPSGSVTRIDPTTDKPIATINTDAPSVIAVSADAIWVTSNQDVNVTRIDPLTNSVVGTVDPGGSGPIAIAIFDGYVWVANHDGDPTGSVAKIDPAKMKVVDLIHVGAASDAGPVWIAVGAGSLWVDVDNISAVVRIDPIKDTVIATIPVLFGCGEVVANDHDVWVAGACGPGVTHIDPATNSKVGVENEFGVGAALALGEGSLWFGTSTRLDRIDPSTRKIVGQLKLPGPSFGAAAAFGYVWITDMDDEQLFKIKPA
jgi:YVTN family beta-propeller protein